MTRILSFFLVCMLSGLLAYAQTRVVTGVVTDANGVPIAGASVQVKDGKGTSTDLNGKYSISVPLNGILIFSGSGVETATINSKNLSMINASLKQAVNDLGAVLVTSLNRGQTKPSIGTSVANVRSAEINQAKVVNLQNGLTGKVSGLNIQTINNGVNSDTRILLRGYRSLTGNNQPLLVLDGVPMALSYINSIDPNTVVDVTVLKSAASAGIYGSDGVNGALVVTTKKGTRSVPSISLTNTTQFESVSFMPKLQQQFGAGSAVNANGYGEYTPWENQTYGDAFDGSVRVIGRVSPSGAYQYETYSSKAGSKYKFWDVGITNQTSLSYTAENFYISVQNVAIKGIVPKDERNKKTVQLSANKELGKFKTNFSVTYNNSDKNTGNSGDIYWSLLNTAANVDVTKYKNWREDYWSSPNGYYNDYYTNPYTIIDLYRTHTQLQDFLGNIDLSLKVTKWLNLSYRFGGNYTSEQSKFTQEAYTYSAFAKASDKSNAKNDLTSGVADGMYNYSRINSEFIATATKAFKKWGVDFLIGQLYRQDQEKRTGVSSSTLAVPEIYNISIRKGEPGVFETNAMYRIQRFFSRLNLNWKKWLFLEVNAANDMDSRLGNPYDFSVKNISFFYPSANLSFVATEAFPSIKSNDPQKGLTYLKVRAAAAKTGNVNLGSREVNLGAYNLQNKYPAAGNFPYGDIVGYQSDGLLRLPKYEPEFVKTLEAGFEVTIASRYSLEASIYQQKNENQVVVVNYSASTGFPFALLNAANFINKGLEFDLKLTPLVKLGKVNIDFKANYSYQDNKVNSIVKGQDELNVGNGNYVITNNPIYLLKGTDYTRDPSGKVIIDSKSGMPTVATTTATFGRTTPKHFLGLNMSVNWRNFVLAVVADYRAGSYMLPSALANALDFTGIGIRSAYNNRNPFIFPNSVIADGPGKYVANTSVYTPGGYNFFSQSISSSVVSNYILSADFWKVREVSMSYTLPQSLFSGSKWIKSGNITLSARNLFMFLPKENTYTDPEFSSSTGNATGVSNLGNTPPTRIIGLSATLNF